MLKKVLVVIAIVLFGAALLLVPVLVKKDSLINLMIVIMLYVSLASAWNILGGFTGQTSLGHAAYFGLGSLVTRLLWVDGFPLIPSVLAGGGVAVAFALLIGVPAFQAQRGLFRHRHARPGPNPQYHGWECLPNHRLAAGGRSGQLRAYPRYYFLLGVAVITVGRSALLYYSRRGLGMMAVREQEDAAESLGVNALTHKLLALALSAFLTGLAGGAFAYYHVSYYYQFPFTPVWSLDALTMVYIGGVGTIIGPVIGAIFFVVVKEFLVLNLGEYHLLVFGVLFILVVLFLPGGLVEAWKKIQKAVRRRSSTKKSSPSLAV